jgi:DNA polymerase-3 subunit gamma/tau
VYCHKRYRGFESPSLRHPGFHFIMPYEVFARKWRPQLFEEVLGQEHITQTLQNAIVSGRLAHAYLFSGARGVGKTSVARIFAKTLNCEQGAGDNPCNDCTSCTEITNSSSIDVQEIDGASNRGIDEIRNLRENIRYLPSHGKYRIYIIDEVHMLTLPAFNALLKTLEEPPEHVKFVFATTEPHKVPVTILSRCQRFDFKRIPIRKIEEQLKKIIATEEITITDTGISLIAREAEGSMRDAESLLDQVVSFTGQSIEDSQIGTVLGIIDRDLIYKMLRAIIDADNKGCLEIIDEIYNYGYEIKEFYREIMNQFRNLIVSLVAPDSTQLLDLPDNERTETERLAKKAGMERLVQSLNFLIAKEGDLRYTNNPRIALEAILIRLSQLKDYLSFDELIKKIEAIENRIDTPTRTAPPADRVEIPVQRGSEPKPVYKDGGKEWDDFLGYVAKKNRAMANVLKELKFHSLKEDRLELPNGEGSFTAGYFDDPDHHEQLLAYVHDFFDPDLKVVFTKQGESGNAKNHAKKDTLPAAAQDIIDLFEGKIVKRP